MNAINSLGFDVRDHGGDWVVHGGWEDSVLIAIPGLNRPSMSDSDSMLNNHLINGIPVARRNHLVRMRLAEALSDGQWHSIDAIVDRFLSEHWSFINAKQLSTLCRGTTGIEGRHRMGCEREFRLTSPSAFYSWMERPV